MVVLFSPPSRVDAVMGIALKVLMRAGREEWTHCEDHKLSSFWLCSSNNFINITSAISTVYFFIIFNFAWLWLSLDLFL